MMPDTSLQIAAIFLLIIANGVFALSEIAVVSARKPRLRHLAEEGKRQAQIALDLVVSPNEFLSTVQVGITLIGTLAGAVGGATLAERGGAYLDTIPAIAPHGEAVAISGIVIAITYFSLILGELVPKRLALSNPEGFAMLVAGPMRLLAKVIAPVVHVLSWSTEAVLKLVPLKKGDEPPITEEEIRMMIEEGTKTGAFEETEQEMIEGVFRLGDRRVFELMQSKISITWIDIQHPLERIRATIASSAYSRFPVGDGSLNHVLGYVHVRDLLHHCIEGRSLCVKSALRHLPAVPERMRAIRVLEIFQKEGTHIALVVDEHGTAEGLITMHDIVEAVVGALPAPGEKVDTGATQREDGSWLVDGWLPIFQYKHILEINELPGEDHGAFTTVGGFVLAHMGRIPKMGDRFEAAGRRYEVVDMDGNRIDKVLVSEAPGEPADGSAA
jgi:putative hemolysin